MEVLAGLDPHGKKFNFLQSLLSYIFIFIIFRVNYINGPCVILDLAGSVPGS